MKRAIDWGLLALAALCLAWALYPRSPEFARVPVMGGAATSWTYTNLQGQAVHSTDFTNQVLIINYWATFCPPCRAEIPAFNAFYTRHHRSGLEIVGIAVDQEGSELVAPFVKRYDMKYPVVLYDFAPLPPLAGQMPLPTTFIVNRSGKIVAHYIGALTEEELEKTVVPLLAEAPAPHS